MIPFTLYFLNVFHLLFLDVFSFCCCCVPCEQFYCHCTQKLDRFRTRRKYCDWLLLFKNQECERFLFGLMNLLTWPFQPLQVYWPKQRQSKRAQAGEIPDKDKWGREDISVLSYSGNRRPVFVYFFTCKWFES